MLYLVRVVYEFVVEAKDEDEAERLADDAIPFYVFHPQTDEAAIFPEIEVEAMD